MPQNSLLNRPRSSPDPLSRTNQIMNQHQRQTPRNFNLPLITPLSHDTNPTFRSSLSNCDESRIFSRTSFSKRQDVGGVFGAGRGGTFESLGEEGVKTFLVRRWTGGTGIEDEGFEGAVGFGGEVVEYPCCFSVKIHLLRIGPRNESKTISGRKSSTVQGVQALLRYLTFLSRDFSRANRAATFEPALHVKKSPASRVTTTFIHRQWATYGAFLEVSRPPHLDHRPRRKRNRTPRKQLLQRHPRRESPEL